jgi:ubiquinone/menaquinone biosynthesis C-methylase UbiE
MMDQQDLPEPEQRFVQLIEEKYSQHGLSKESPLFSFYVQVSSVGTYIAGLRVARELALLTDLKGKKVLDIGCGVGGSLVALSREGAECCGVDLSVSDLQLSSQRLEAHGLEKNLVCGDGFCLPFGDAHFDIVICTEMLEHINQRERLVGEIARVLKVGGVVYLSFPSLLSWRNFISDPHYHLFGVTLLPLPLANWYTRKVRGLDYHVEILPVPAAIVRLCAKNGMEVYSINASEEVLLDRIAHPEKIKRKLIGNLISFMQALRLTWLLKGMIKIRANTLSGAVLAGFKSS